MNRMRNTAQRREPKQQQGQAAVFIVLCLFTTVAFMAMATNFGILVNDRVRMQNTADFSAYAGAFEQARVMNEITTLNDELYSQVQHLRGVLNYGPAYDETEPPDEDNIFYWRQPACFCQDYSPAAQITIKKVQQRLDALIELMNAKNMAGQPASMAAATQTASQNFLGRHTSQRHLDFFQDNPDSPTSDDEVVDMIRVTTTMVGYNYLRSCPCCDGCCLYPDVHVEPINSWYYKDPAEGLVYFPAMVKGVPWKNFLDLGRRGQRLFGADASRNPVDHDILYGYASAKPFEGNIGTSDPDNGDGSEVPQQPVYPPSDDYDDYFAATYRARIAGIHEEMGTSTQSRSMAELIEEDASEPQFQSKVGYFTH